MLIQLAPQSPDAIFEQAMKQLVAGEQPNFDNLPFQMPKQAKPVAAQSEEISDEVYERMLQQSLLK